MKYFKKQSFQNISLILHLIIKVGLLIKYSKRNLSLERFDQFSTLKNDFENQNFEMFEEVVHNFGKSDSDII